MSFKLFPTVYKLGSLYTKRKSYLAIFISGYCEEASLSLRQTSVLEAIFAWEVAFSETWSNEVSHGTSDLMRD